MAVHFDKVASVVPGSAPQPSAGAASPSSAKQLPAGRSDTLDASTPRPSLAVPLAPAKSSFADRIVDVPKNVEAIRTREVGLRSGKLLLDGFAQQTRAGHGPDGLWRSEETTCLTGLRFKDEAGFFADAQTLSVVIWPVDLNANGTAPLQAVERRDLLNTVTLFRQADGTFASASLGAGKGLIASEGFHVMSGHELRGATSVLGYKLVVGNPEAGRWDNLDGEPYKPYFDALQPQYLPTVHWS